MAIKFYLYSKKILNIKNIIPEYYPKHNNKKVCNKKSILFNENGIALVMILVLSAIALLIIAAMLFMITSSTQISGMQKIYKTAREASFGGAELVYQYISLRGIEYDTNNLNTVLSSLNPEITIPGGIDGSSGCQGVDGAGITHYGLSAKLLTPTSTWTNCDSSISIDPNNCNSSSCSYDMKFEVPGNPTNYIVYAKIVDTVEGNSAADRGLGGEGVVVAGGSVVRVISVPYLYTIEMDAQSATNPSERAKLSILYEY